MNPQVIVHALRGRVVSGNPGCRGIYHLTMNPGCMRLRAATALGVTMPQVAEILDVRVREGQSVFALNRGKHFDDNLYASGAARLVDLYRQKRNWPQTDCRVLDLRDVGTIPGGKSPGAVAARAATQDRRVAATENALPRKARGDPESHNLVIQPVLTITVVGCPYVVIADLLVASTSDRSYRVAEVKSFPDRQSKADPADVTAATRQAPVGVVALRQWRARNGCDANDVPDSADLIFFSVLGAFTPTLTTQKVSGEINAIERALAMAPTTLDELTQLLPPGGAFDRADVIEGVPANYNDTCRSFCVLAQNCKGEAIRLASPRLP